MPAMLQFGVELVLAVGAMVCFAVMVWYLKKTWDDYSPVSSTHSLGWLLGLQM